MFTGRISSQARDRSKDGRERAERHWLVKSRNFAQERHCLGWVAILDNAQYDRIYICDNAEMRKKRSALDSKYGVCFRVAISLIPRLIERANLANGSALAVVIESGHQNIGAAPEISRAFNELADEAIRSLLKSVTVAEKRHSAGLRSADTMAELICQPRSLRSRSAPQSGRPKTGRVYW
jgi:hypothetical protein